MLDPLNPEVVMFLYSIPFSNVQKRGDIKVGSMGARTYQFQADILSVDCFDMKKNGEDFL
jgi:hypothetical protein